MPRTEIDGSESADDASSQVSSILFPLVGGSLMLSPHWNTTLSQVVNAETEDDTLRTESQKAPTERPSILVDHQYALRSDCGIKSMSNSQSTSADSQSESAAEKPKRTAVYIPELFQTEDIEPEYETVQPWQLLNSRNTQQHVEGKDMLTSEAETDAQEDVELRSEPRSQSLIVTKTETSATSSSQNCSHGEEGASVTEDGASVQASGRHASTTSQTAESGSANLSMEYQIINASPCSKPRSPQTSVMHTQAATTTVVTTGIEEVEPEEDEIGEEDDLVPSQSLLPQTMSSLATRQAPQIFKGSFIGNIPELRPKQLLFNAHTMIIQYCSLCSATPVFKACC